ncbi:MAG: S8 family serine peptidase [candidate division KSB1 bacterium]|nr:S8 family serine peptidase [candidate division KSB1 bacterium]
MLYFNGSFVVAAMGNNNGSQDRVPACYSDIVFSVASANKSNNYSSFSNHNSYVDVTAPGGTNSSSQYDDICVITGDDDVDYMYGTSFSTPLVSGVASLMMSMREDVRAEDVEYILKHTADDIYLAGFDNFTGYGKINAKEAIRRLSSIYNMERYTTNGGTIIQVDNDWKTFVLYADFYTCVAKKYRIEKNISFNNYNQSTILIWGNIDGTLGVAPSNPNYQIPWCGVKEGTITSSSATIQTYVYKCKELYYPYQTFWYPCEPSEVEFAYTVLGDPPPSTPSISLGTQWDPDMHINHPKLTITRGSEDTDEYNIYRMKNGSSFDVVATISCSGTTTTWVDEIIMSTQYYGDNWWYKVKAKDDFGSESDFSNTVYTKGVQVDSSMNKDEPITLEIPELPSGYSLSAFPNPFNPTTNFKIGLPEAGNVKLSVYNSIGQNVFKFDEYREAGYQNIVFEAKNLNAGVYFYRLNVKNYSKSGKILYVK